MAIDDGLAEPHASLGWIDFRYEWDWASADNEFRRATVLKPSYATAHHWYALYLSEMTRHEEALAEIHRALELDPLSVPITASVGTVLLQARRYDAALEQVRKALEHGKILATLSPSSSSGTSVLRLENTRKPWPP